MASSWTAGERPPFAGSLDFDQPAAAQSDDVEVDFGGRVFAVVEVEHRTRRRRSLR